MNNPLFLSNLAVYSLQIGLLVALGAVVPVILRMRAPAGRLIYWHILLVACLVLPLVRPWRQEVITAKTVVPVSTPSAGGYAPAAPANPDFPWSRAALWALAGGAALRFAWLMGGLWRLRRYRLHSHPFDTAYDADIRVSADVASPVTFGAFNPVILVPEHFADLPEPMRRVILCHEILHIERRDWLFAMAEETVRAIFWFHPAIWWVLGQIHLAREQAVDRRVIEVTEAREPYVDALLAMAGARPQLDLAPAPLFLKKRHLKHRVVEIFKEVNMSKKSLVSALAAGVALLACACWIVTGAIPLAAAPQMVADGPGVSVNLNGAQLMHRSPIVYPGDAIVKGISGTVVVQVKLDPNGEVLDAAVQSGPEELRRSVMQSVLNWHFMKDSAGMTRTVNVDFTAPEGAVAAARDKALMPAIAPARVPVVPTPGNALRNLAGIDVTGLSDEAKTELLGQLPVHVGDTVGPDQFVSVMEAARKFDPHLTAVFVPKGSEYELRIFAPGGQGGAVGGVLGSIVGSMPTAQQAPPVPAGQRRISVGGTAQAEKLVTQTPPVYPPLAKQARISGTVELSAIIGTDGHVVNLSVVKGHPLLVQSSLDAVKDWVYQPTLLNGQPVQVQTTIDVNFTLAP
ncbi:MAG TPA: M56 family metallopeptidase [Bryobacteraceae bacterium]|nr:M56 family metallopeptidase [Bryobacteraceae bacterium]